MNGGKPVIGGRDLRLAYGNAPLLDGIGFQVTAGERIALVGRNGSGKSTLLRLLAGELTPDGGEVISSPGLRVARLAQEVPQALEGTVFEVVASGVAEVGALLAEYHHISHNLHGDSDLARLEQVQHRLEVTGAWDHEREVETAISRLQLPEDVPFEALSGGLKRRVLLARALVAEPDLLLLDEPTNHLDVPAIEWLEELILGMSCALVFITHDRAFLRRLATRILELDRGRLFDWPGNFERYLELKEAQQRIEVDQNARFDQKLAQEEVWIRQGVKARRTRDEGRVKALERLREERRARRQATGEARLRMTTAERSGKIVFEAEDVSFSYSAPGSGGAGGSGSDSVVHDFSGTILRGDKVGILGPNGAGKTTLLKLLLGQLQPTSGTIRQGTKLEIAYFDQHREQLDDDASVADNVADGNDKVVVDGQPRHVIGYLQDFLFPASQARGPVRALSGGERHRLLLARLFTRPFNVLAMDEPTNDLDVETLELLENLLVRFAGTLLLVSHDRAFLDNVVTSTLVMEGQGRIGEYAGGYEDWLLQRPAAAPTKAAGKAASKEASRAATKAGGQAAGKPAAKATGKAPTKEPTKESRKAATKPANGPTPKTAPTSKSRDSGRRKLGYREVQELNNLPARIEALEAERASLQHTLGDPTTYQSGANIDLVATRARLTSVAADLEHAYARWAELEPRAT